MNPRRQGDLGEFSAIEWLGSRGYPIAIPLGHSPDYDLISEIDDRLVRIQVKTSTLRINGRFQVSLRTNGGNQSWTGLVKRFSCERCDWLFVLVGDGRRWFIPATAVEGTTGITLGGPKYAEYAVEPGRPLTEMLAA
jgi:PD-(D/E)XK endonuclease